MKAWRKKLTLGAAVWLCLMGYASSQDAILMPNQSLTSYAESLKSRGIDVSPSSLRAALHNSDPQIRSLAANKLAEDHDIGAIPLIRDALAAEANPHARIGMAGALFELHDAQGVEVLHAMCADKSLPISSLIEAAQTLQMISQLSGACSGVVLDALNRPDAIDYRVAIVTLLPAFYRKATTDESARIVAALEALLVGRSEQPAVRRSVASALVQIGDRTAAETIRVAIAREEDPAMRTALQAYLDALLKKP